MNTNENNNHGKNPQNELEEKVIKNRTDSSMSGQKRKKIINIISIIIGVGASILTFLYGIFYAWYSSNYLADLAIVISVPIGVLFRLISRWAIPIVVGFFEKTIHNKQIRLRVIFVLILLISIGWGIRGNPLSSGHLLLQYSLGRRDFRRIKFNGADLSGANLEEATLIEADLREANLSDANLKGANLRWAYLAGAGLGGADLSGAYLQWADLSDVDLSNADLSGADLRWVDLSGADLSDVDLSNADLSNADLSGVDLSGTDLHGARLINADLSGANVLISVLNNVYLLFCATMPDGTTYNGHLNLSGDLDFAEDIRDININDDEAMAKFYCITLEEYLQGQERNGSE